MPITDLSHIDTTPGNGGPFSPPAGFTGSLDDYTKWFRGLFANDPYIAQATFVAWRMRVINPGRTTSVGPYAAAFDRAIKGFEHWSKQKQEH